MRHDKLGVSLPSALNNIDPASQNDESARRDLAGRDHALARRIGFALTEPRQPLDLVRLERRKHLIASGLDQRTYRLRHGFPYGFAARPRSSIAALKEIWAFEL